MSTTTDWPTCRCGCGEPVKARPHTRIAKGWVKGEPSFYADGCAPGAGKDTTPLRYTVDPVTGCWNWNGECTQKGYGRYTLNGKRVRAHRQYYERHRGPIPDGHDIHHTCQNPACVNPAHLEAIDVRTHAALARAGVVPLGEYERVLRELRRAEQRIAELEADQ